MLGILSPILVPVTQNRYGQAGKASEKSHKDDQIRRLKEMNGNGNKVLLGRFWLCIKGKLFTWEQPAIRIVSPEKWWIPQCWTPLRFRWTECWAILYSPFFLFAKKNCNRWSLRFLPTGILGFYDLMEWKETKIHSLYVYIQIMHKMRYTLMQYMEKITMYIQSCLSLQSTTQKRILLFHMDYILHLERMIACTWASGSGNLGMYVLSLRVAKHTVNNAIQVTMAPNTHLPPHKWAGHLSYTGQIIQIEEQVLKF